MTGIIGNKRLHGFVIVELKCSKCAILLGFYKTKYYGSVEIFCKKCFMKGLEDG